VFVELLLLLPFSLTKYSVIFTEVKGCFGINNNQLGSFNGGCLSPCSLIIRFIFSIREIFFKNLWGKMGFLRCQFINQLERVVVSGVESNSTII
jgi:hypothetical protein